MTRATFQVSVYEAMVQTPFGANSNPWISYMKECRINYTSTKAAALIENGESSMPNKVTTKHVSKLVAKQITKDNEIKKEPQIEQGD